MGLQLLLECSNKENLKKPEMHLFFSRLCHQDAHSDPGQASPVNEGTSRERLVRFLVWPSFCQPRCRRPAMGHWLLPWTVSLLSVNVFSVILLTTSSVCTNKPKTILNIFSLGLGSLSMTKNLICLSSPRSTISFSHFYFSVYFS